MIIEIIIGAAALVIGGVGGYLVFRYVLTGKYNEMMEAAEKEANVMKEKKLLEVKEKFLNKKSELEKEVQVRNMHIQQREQAEAARDFPQPEARRIGAVVRTTLTTSKCA